MKYFSILITLFSIVSISGLAAEYPVDKEINGLREKANYLEQLKLVFETNHCTIELGKTKVALDPGALRSEGLVVAIGDGFPGNYMGYHKAPKPEQLENIIDWTLQKPGAGKGASIITARLAFKDGKADQLAIIVNEPYQVPSSPELWMYTKAHVITPISISAQSKIEVKGVTEQTKRPFTLNCN